MKVGKRTEDVWKGKGPCSYLLKGDGIIALTDPGRGSGDCQEDRERTGGGVERGT